MNRFGIAGLLARKLLLLGALVCFPAPSQAGDETPPDVKIGLLQGMFRDVQPAMMHALARPFREMMQKQTGFTGDVEICPDALNLVDRMKKKEVHLGVFHGFEFAWAQTKCPELVPILVTMPPGGKVQACVIVNRDCPATCLEDLKDELVVIPRAAKGHSLAFLEKARVGLAKNVARTANKASMTAEDALNGVAGGELTAVLVDSAAVEGYQALQPGASKQLKVLVRSEEFPPAVIAYRTGMLSEDQVAAIRTGMAGAQKSATGKMLMTMWNLKGFQAPPENFQAHLDAILKAYPLPEKTGVTINPVSRQK